MAQAPSVSRWRGEKDGAPYACPVCGSIGTGAGMSGHLVEEHHNPYYDPFDEFYMEIVKDEHTALVTPHQFARLHEYSCSIPSGKYVGKQWKCKVNYYDETRGWVLVEYAELDPPDPDNIAILRRELLVVE